MHRRRVFIILAVFCTLLFSMVAHAQLPQISSGLSYLSSSQNLDGTWGSGSATVETTAVTVTVLETFKLLNQTAGTTYTSGTAWLQGQAPLTVAYIAERIHALSLADGSANALIPALDTLKGGWGGYDGYETNSLDTSLALQALKAANYTDLTTINPSLAYLTGSQNPDGGWGFSSGDDSNVYMTAIVSATLQQFPQMTSIATAVSKATSYLFAHQNPDGGFDSSPSTVYESALAYAALVAFTTNEAALGSAINYLTTTQSANGSWNEDPYSTALALKALYLSENRPSPPPPQPAGGKITGTVIDKVTGQKVAGVAVVLESNQLINTTTDSSGNFTLSDIPAGAQKVNFSLNGYASTAATTTVVVDTTASLGNVPMVSSYSTGTIAGTITDSTGKPLTGVAIIITGAWSGSATTGADGTYSFSYVTPGTVTLSAAKSGYQTVTANGTVYARTTLSFSPRMSTTASQVTTGTLVGRVVDSYWGVPIGHLPEETGVIVTLSGGTTIAVEPEGGGYFAIPNLAPGTYQVIVGMHGFASHTYRVVITLGGTTDLGTIRLEMSFLMTLTGKITDASTGAPIPGAEVTIQGKDFTGRTDSFGTYAIADIPNPGEYTIKFSAAGYVGKSYTVGASSWLQTMDMTLSPQVTKGSLSGTVIDAATGLPLAGVTLTLVSDPNITTATDSTGTFTLNAVPPGPQQAILTLSGYSTRTLTTTITVGAVTDVGTISLSTTPLPAAIQGTVWDAVANAPFAGVEIQASGTGSLLTVTAAEGTYKLDNVTPGAITVATGAVPKPGYNSARFTATLESGGILVFNAVLSTILPTTVDLTVQTDKPVYRTGDTVGIATHLQNKESEPIATALHLLVTDPSGSNVYETSVNANLAADGADDQSFNFLLPVSAQAASYTVLVESFSDNGSMLARTAKNFGVAVSQILLTPTLPAVFSTGANPIIFNLTNIGTVAVSAGVISVTLKDPDGQVVSATSLPFTLDLGQSKTLTPTVAIPALKFGTYTLFYSENDETKSGAVTDILLPNNVAITGMFDDTSHRIRETANLTVTLVNMGRFNLDTGSTSQTIALKAEVPDAGYSETKTLSTTPVVGSASGSILLYHFAIPETLTSGQHGTKITVTLPSGSSTTQTTQLAIMESSLSLSSLQTTYTAGIIISPVIANGGGVDTTVQYKLSLYDAKAAVIAEATSTGTTMAGAQLPLALAIPVGAVDGNYNLVVNYKDTKTGKEGISPNAITINGVKGSIQVQTNKQNYLLTENITGLSTTTSTGTSLTGGNLHLQVSTGAGAQKMKTWTTQADFQTGVRSGVDTYGVNDWIIPDDDFSGTPVNGDRWKSFINNGGVLPTNTGEQLQLETSGVTNSTSGVTSNFQLDGDFDIQVDYEIKPFMNGNSHALFIASFDDGNYFRVGRVGNYYQSYNTSPITNYLTSSSDIKGKLRLTRTGNVAKTWYWNGSQWINHYTWTVSTTPVRIQLCATSYLGTEQLHVKFDNFKVNSGRIKTENQTVDSVRLLPLNDNFDDGVLNEDRWIKGGSNTPTESVGVLHLQSNSASSGNAVQLRASLPGDFSAVTSFKNFAATPSGVSNGELYLIANIGTSGFYLVRSSDILSRASGQFIVGLSIVNNNFFMGAEAPYSSQSGSLRLRKVGNTGYDEYWDGTKWVTVFSDSRMPLSPANISLSTGSNWNKPAVQVDLDSFSTDKGTYAGNGTIYLKFDSGTSGNKWSKFLYSSTQPVGTTIKFRTRTAETETGLATATWSDYLTVSGFAVNNPAARWIQIEATLSTTNTNVTPLLHDVSVTYESNPGEILWQTDVHANLAQGAASQMNHAIGTLGMTGKFYLEGTLTSSTGQTVATADYPFYVEQSNIQISLATDKKIYRPGETVTIGGEVKNLSSIAATGLTARVQGAGVATPYSETFDLPANSGHPFSFTTTVGNAGIYGLSGVVTQNTTTLAEIADQYEVVSPALTATLTAPDTVGSAPFNITLSLNNTGKVNAVTTMGMTDDSGNVIDSQAVTILAGETRMLQYTRQISGATTYSAVLTGDANQTLAKTVTYNVVVSDRTVSAKIVTDKISYNPNEQVSIISTITANSTQENLSAFITVVNSQGQGAYSATAALPVVIQGQMITINKYWNTGTNAAGTYLVTLQILNAAGTVISNSTCDLVISSATKPTAILKGRISLDNQSILTGEPVTVSYSVTNAGNMDLSNIALSVQTINLTEQTVYNTTAAQATVAMGASYTNSSQIDTQSYSAKDYLVVLRANIAGVEETIAGTYFRVEGAPSAPALSSPANGADVETFTPNLSVSNAADPNDDKLTYEFEIYTDSGLTNLLTSGTVSEMAGSNAWTVTSPLTENQIYHWRARAYDGRLYGPWMSPASFRVNTVDDPPTAPTIASPADGTAVAVFNPTLTINNASDPDSASLTYNFYVALDPDFTQILGSVKGVPSGLGATSWTVPVSLQENTSYYWRAQADDWLIEGPWSSVSRFFVNTFNDAPSAPIITTPADNGTVTTLSTDIAIANSTDPDSSGLFYFFEADTAITFGSADLIRSGSVAEGSGTTTWHLDGLKDNTRYYLRVKAGDGTADSPWSSVVSFFANTVNDPPTTPALANPSSGAGVSLFTPTLSVHNATDPDHDTLTYEFEVYADAAKTNLITHAAGIAETWEITSWTVPAQLAENQTYYWQARAFDGALNSEWMPMASFMVNTANDAPGAPTLSLPVEGGSIATVTPTLAVTNAVDPDSTTVTYGFEIYSGSSLVVAVNDVPQDISGITAITLGTVLTDNTRYQWRARAYDGDSYGPWTSMANFSVHLTKTAIGATINFDPDTLNKKSNGNWVTVYIELPAGYMPSDIDISSLRLEGTIPPVLRPFALGDCDKDGIPDLMVKFNRSDLIRLLPNGDNVPVHVSGKVGLITFEGVDVIRVIP